MVAPLMIAGAGMVAGGMLGGLFNKGKESTRSNDLSTMYNIYMAGQATNEAERNSALATRQEDRSDRYEQLAREVFAYDKAQTEEMKPYVLQGLDTENRVALANEARAADYDAYEKNTFRPIEKALVADAVNYNTEGKREELARAAGADVAHGYAGARANNNAELMRMGINPNSGRFAALNSQILTSEAADAAGAATRARLTAEETGHARMQDAAALGRNISSNASTAYGIATQSSGAAVGGANQTVGTNTNAIGSPVSYLGASNQAAGNAIGARGTAIQGYGTALSGYGNAGRNAATTINASANNANNRSDLFGTLAGVGIGMMGKADGGPVDDTGLVMGPGDGSGIDDQVPAVNVDNGQRLALSSEEYVIPADVVRVKGTEFFDNIVAKYHVPAQQQRTAISTMR